MLHLGDITQIDGGKIPPVDVVVRLANAVCPQIGNRTGLAGDKSGSLFYQAMRINQK